MTQKCKHDEQLLDFVYGELSDAERKIFAEHLPGCSACSAQVEGFGQVRKEFQQRPPIEPVGESMQRMTALLMQAAAASAPAASSAAVDGGGKVLAFRARGLRRILFHPAGGVMAVAAAALFWVVFRAQPVPQSGLVAPSAPLTIGMPSGSVAAPTKPAETATETATATPPVADPLAKNLPVATDKSESAKAAGPEPVTRGTLADNQNRKGKSFGGDADFAGLRGKSQGAKDIDSLGLRAMDEKKPEPPAKPQMVAQRDADKPMAPAAATLKTMVPMDGRSVGTQAGGKSEPRSRAGEAQYRQSNSGPAVVAMADQAYAKSAKKEAGLEAERPADRWAQPPATEPPPPPPAQAAPAASPPAPRPNAEEDDSSVHRAIARTKEQRKQKVVEELANQELGGLNAGAPAGAPATQQSGEGRYAQHVPSTGNSYKADTGASNFANRAAATDDAPTAAATPALAQNSMQQSHGSGNAGLPDDGAAVLTTVKEQIRRGQCAEANATLTKLERSSPTLHGLAETRAEWQSTCAAPTQQLLDRRMYNESPEPSAQAAPYRASKMRMASPAPAKKASPKPAKPVDRGAAKASDLAL